MKNSAAVTLAALLFVSCSPRDPVAKVFETHGETGEIAVAPSQHDQLGEAAAYAVGIIQSTRDELDATRPGSDVSRINRAAASVRFQVSFDTFRLIDLAQHYGELAGGAFDLTANRLGELWGLYGEPPAEPPDDITLDASMEGVGPANLQLFDQGAVAFLSPATRLDIGPIATAYAADLAILELRRRGFSNSRLRYGAATRVLGDAGPNRPWTATIQHPFTTGETLGTLPLGGEHAALTLLAPFENPLIIGGRPYSRVIDPRNGRPINGVALVAVLAPTATKAHVLAHAVAVLGINGCADALGRFPRCEVLVVPDRQPLELWATAGFREQLVQSALPAVEIRDLTRTAFSDPEAAAE